MPRFKTNLTTQGRVVSTQLPISDDEKNDWTEVAGDADGDAFDELDEGIAATDDATTAWQHTNDGLGPDILKCKMTSRDTPSDPTKMLVQVRWRALVGDINSAEIRIFSPVGTQRYVDATVLTTAEGWVTRAAEGSTGVDLSSVPDWTDVHMGVIAADDVSGERLDISTMQIKQGS